LRRVIGILRSYKLGVKLLINMLQWYILHQT
jgi:hypothetical protein